MNNKATEFYLKQLQQLVGGKITQLATTDADESGEQFFGFVVTMPNGKSKTVLFLRDDEGNGPGSFEINDNP